MPAFRHFLDMISTPQSKRSTLNTSWFLFIIIGMGQLGPFIGYAAAFWNGMPVIHAIQESAGKAELLTCATAILASGTFFLVKEYNSPGNIENRSLKSFALLWASFLGLLCILTTAQLLADPGFSSLKQSLVHWIIYFLAIMTAFLLWILEEMQETAQEVVQSIAAESERLIDQSKETQSTPEGYRF